MFLMILDHDVKAKEQRHPRPARLFRWAAVAVGGNAGKRTSLLPT